MKGINETKRKMCNIFSSFENAKSSPFLTFFVFDLSSESTHSFLLQLHIIVFSIRFFLHCLFSIICLSFHLTAHSSYNKNNNHTNTYKLTYSNACVCVCVYVNGYDEKSKYPNLLVVSQIYL